MAKVPNSIETLPKLSITRVGCTNVTDRETFAKNEKCNNKKLKQQQTDN